ncbi:MAG: hypothetical protein CM15mP107_0020 [Bacteroidota bacterium]|nr:MAG: hypothetical protein CM15mP107_0020 [Bacteroidota bacterium]
MQIKNIILASQSPRRKELLNLLDLNFKVVITEVNEVYPENLEVSKVAEYRQISKKNFLPIFLPKLLLTRRHRCLLNEQIPLGKTKKKTEAAKKLKKV